MLIFKHLFLYETNMKKLNVRNCFPKQPYSIKNADEEFNDNLDDITLSSTQMETVNCRCHFIGAWHVVNHCKGFIMSIQDN